MTKQFIVSCIFFICAPFFCFGNIPEDILRHSQEDIIHQEEQRQESYRKHLRYSRPSKALKELNAREDSERQDDDLEVKNIHLSDIQLEGNSVFKRSQLDQLTAPYLNHDVSLKDIETLIRTLTNLYIEKGYVTSRIYIPEQHLSTGILRLKIVESKAASLKILEKGQLRRGFNSVFPIDKDRVFNIRDYEQGLDQINRLRCYNARINLIPGDQVGESKVVIHTDLKRGSKLSGRFETNNGGSHSTGIHQQIVHIGLDDHFGLYDALSLNIRHDMGLNHSGQKNRGFTGSFVLPYDYWTFRFIGDIYKYLQTVRSRLQPFYLTGMNLSYLFEVERIIHRDNMSKTGLSVSMNRKRSNNYINDVKIGVSSKNLTIAAARVFHTRRLWEGALSLSGEYHRGLKLLGATKDSGRAIGSPKAQFNKVKGYISYYKPFQIKGQNFAWQVSGNGAWSRDTLYASEKISIGGSHTVRGYWDQSLSGTIGGYIRNEVIWKLPFDETPLTQHILGHPEFYAGIDVGWIERNKVSKNDHGHLTGLGLGVRTKAEHIFGEVGFERALDRPSSFSKIEHRVFVKLGFDI